MNDQATQYTVGWVERSDTHHVSTAVIAGHDGLGRGADNSCYGSRGR